MRLTLIAIATALFGITPNSVSAQPSVSGEIGIQSKYLDDDLFVYTDEPTIQAGLYVDLNDKCSLDVWGSHGISTKEGSEIDVGPSCRFSVGNAEVEVSIYRDFLHGSSDTTEMNAAVTYGPVDITVSHYFWDNNPDATRILAKYTLEPTTSLSIQPMVVFETGFGEPDILAGGLGAEYSLTDNLSALGTVLTPISGGGERKTQVSIGLNFTF